MYTPWEVEIFRCHTVVVVGGTKEPSPIRSSLPNDGNEVWSPCFESVQSENGVHSSSGTYLRHWKNFIVTPGGFQSSQLQEYSHELFVLLLIAENTLDRCEFPVRIFY